MTIDFNKAASNAKKHKTHSVPRYLFDPTLLKTFVTSVQNTPNDQNHPEIFGWD